MYIIIASLEVAVENMQKLLCPVSCLWYKQRGFKHSKQITENPMANYLVEALLMLKFQGEDTLV